LRDGDFEYQYTLEGDGTVPLALALLAGARHRYVDCGHSDLPLSNRVIGGTIDLLRTSNTRRFAASPPARRASRRWVSDTQLRHELTGKVDWPHMTSRERRVFLDTLNEPPKRVSAGPRTKKRSPVKNRRKKR